MNKEHGAYNRFRDNIRWWQENTSFEMSKELEIAIHYLTNRTICRTKQVVFNYDAYIRNIQIVVNALKLYALKDSENQHLVDIDLLGTACKTNLQIQNQSNQLLDVMTGEYKEEDYSPEKIGIKCEITTKEIFKELTAKESFKILEEITSEFGENYEYMTLKEAYPILCDTIESTLNRLEKLEKVLKIIKEKRFDMNAVKYYETYSEYIGYSHALTETEFNLLKEYLK